MLRRSVITAAIAAAAAPTVAPAADRTPRPARALASVRGCLDEGIDMKSYIFWSLLDNFEWTSAYSQHFGLVAVDRETFSRTPKPKPEFCL